MADETKPETQAAEEHKQEEKPTITLEQAQAENARLAKELADARKEAAKYRVEKKDAVKEVETTLAERMAALEKQLNEERRSNLINSVAHKHNLPEALAARLKGETPEELEADALALAAYVKPTTQEPQKAPPLSSTAPAGAPTLTLDAIKKMTPQEVLKNQDAVNAFLSSQK